MASSSFPGSPPNQSDPDTRFKTVSIPVSPLGALQATVGARGTVGLVGSGMPTRLFTGGVGDAQSVVIDISPPTDSSSSSTASQISFSFGFIVRFSSGASGPISSGDDLFRL